MINLEKIGILKLLEGKENRKAMFIEAYADAAVRYGIQRDKAYELVSATLMGAARMQLMTGEHPAVLKDKVCSPAGSTIKGVIALEREGFRRACQTSIDEIMKS